MKEIWKAAVGYEGYLEVSNMGNVRSVDRIITVTDGERVYQKPVRGKAKAKNVNVQTGYYQIGVNHGKHVNVHRLVAEAFLVVVHGKTVVNHKDGNKLNNSVDNLEWTTYGENNKHAFVIGLKKQAFRVRIVETGEVFSSVSECARIIGTHEPNIQKCLKKERHTAGGFHYERITEDEYKTACGGEIHAKIHSTREENT